MHDIKTTKAVLLGSRDYGEADKMLMVLTRDFGFVYVLAKGVRLEKSKLRYHIQEYKPFTISLVKGREFWRLTSAESLGLPIVKNKQYLELFSRVSSLLRRLLHGEDTNIDLFDSVYEAYEYLSDVKNAKLPDNLIEVLESLIVLRIMYCLGYINNNTELGQFIDSALIDEDILRNAYEIKATINRHINNALKEAQL
jgi:DNA repair protein RecO